MLDVLQQVLNEAHSGHVYKTDYELHGVLEDWRPELIGDCDSFALWVRGRLEERKILSNLIFCKTENNEGHLVVEVGGWILDNRYTWVMARQDIPYKWVKLGTPEGDWFEIEE